MMMSIMREDDLVAIKTDDVANDSWADARADMVLFESADFA
jgi:hypothetical protein